MILVAIHKICNHANHDTYHHDFNIYARYCLPYAATRSLKSLIPERKMLVCLLQWKSLHTCFERKSVAVTPNTYIVDNKSFNINFYNSILSQSITLLSHVISLQP